MSLRKSRMLRLTVVAVLGLLVGSGVTLGVAFSSSQSKTASKLGPPTGATLAALQSLSRTVSAVYGESLPTGGQVVASTRQQANRVVNGADIADNRDVYVMTLNGHFRALRGGPFGAPPQGPVLTLIIDPTTMTPLDSTISKSVPSLALLGSPQPLG